MVFDTHAHLDFPEFTADLDAIVSRAELAGVGRIISIGTDLESSRRSIQISERCPGVYAAIGWHPGNVLTAPGDIRDELKTLASHPKVVAIGETGLDYHRLPSQTEGCTKEDDERYKARQKELFRQHLEVAAATGLNCVIHQRDCFEETLEALRPFSSQVRGVFHCFVGTPVQMHQVVEIGSLVSFTGIITFKNAQEVRETLVATPDDRFMLETDCPYLAPVPFRGKRCEPAYVRVIAETAALTRGQAGELIETITSQTARAFFSKLN